MPSPAAQPRAMRRRPRAALAAALWPLAAGPAAFALGRPWHGSPRGIAPVIGLRKAAHSLQRAEPQDAAPLTPLSPPGGFAPPEPQPLSVTRTDLLPALLAGSVALLLRFLSGVFVVGWRPGTVADGAKSLKEGKYALQLGPISFRDGSDSIDGKFRRPAKPLVLYEYEASPFCRKVREALCMLDVPCEMRPCPGARTGFSEELARRTGRRTVPYLVDPNAEVEMFESDDIVDYLFDTYGPGKDAVPWVLRGPLVTITAAYASVVRGFAGAKPEAGARPDNVRRQPLEMWGYEASPFVKLVREKLCALMLPHVVVPASRGSANRDALVARTGRFQVPFLRDPNTGVELFEAPEICEYLQAVYTL